MVWGKRSDCKRSRTVRGQHYAMELSEVTGAFAWLAAGMYMLRFIMIFRGIRIWRSDSESCLALIFRKTLITRIYRNLCRNSGLALAHFLRNMVSGIFVFSAWREQKRCGADIRESDDRFFSDRAVARRGNDVCALGRLLRSASGD